MKITLWEREDYLTHDDDDAVIVCNDAFFEFNCSHDLPNRKRFNLIGTGFYRCGF